MRFAACLAPMLRAGDTVLLSGDLGAGKSVLSRGIARGMGVKGAMPSPTFTLMIPYQGETGKFYHFDLYRLSDPDEYYAAGLDEFIGGDGVAAVEWPEMADVEVDRALVVTLSRGKGEDERLIDIVNRGVEHYAPEALAEWRLAAQ